MLLLSIVTLLSGWIEGGRNYDKKIFITQTFIACSTWVRVCMNFGFSRLALKFFRWLTRPSVQCFEDMMSTRSLELTFWNKRISHSKLYLSYLHWLPWCLMAFRRQRSFLRYPEIQIRQIPRKYQHVSSDVNDIKPLAITFLSSRNNTFQRKWLLKQRFNHFGFLDFFFNQKSAG